LKSSPNPKNSPKGPKKSENENIRKASHGAELKDMAVLPKQEQGFIATKLTNYHKQRFWSVQ